MIKEVVICDYCNEIIAKEGDKLPYGTISFHGTISIQQSSNFKMIPTPDCGLHFCRHEHFENFIVHLIVEGDREVEDIRSKLEKDQCRE